MSAQASAAPAKKGPRWLGPAKVVFAVLVLAVVVSRLPWRDTLVWRDGERELTGTIHGAWDSERIVFELDPAEAAAPDLPAELRARVGEGGRIEAARGFEGAQLDWRPGMPRVFGGVRPSGLALAFASLFVGVLFTTARWWVLLRAAGCPTSPYHALRLTLLGFFFNLVVPGLTGGDLIKAVLAAREHPSRRAGAAMSVLVDRLIGLFALALLGAGVVLALGERFRELRTPVLLAVAAGVLGAVVYSNRTLRRVARIDALLLRIPLGGVVRQIDEAVLVYSRKPSSVALALLLSFLNHFCVVAGILALGHAFGESVLSTWDYVAVVSMGNIASALPVAPGGWGVGEAAYGFLFGLLGASATLGVAISITFRLCLMTIGVLGGAFLLVPGSRAELRTLALETGAAAPGDPPAPGPLARPPSRGKAAQ